MTTSVDIKAARRISRLHNNGLVEVAGYEWTRLSVGDVLAINTDLPRLAKLGVDEDHTSCDLCGKTNLKHTVAYRVLDGGEDIFFGTDCAESIEFFQRRRAA